MKKIYFTVLFIIALIGISWFYHYPEIAWKRPQSIHKWRQSDCASLALNYYQGGMHFFRPETHNLTSDGGTSGKSCPSEIPVLYFLVAILYKVFGYHEFIYRIFNTFLFFLGLFFLFRLLLFMLKDVFWAIVLSLIFFTAPVLVYYGNNFLSNSSSLAFSIAGWYYFIRFSVEAKPRWFYLSMFIFFIAAAFKVTALFSLFAITGIYLLELAGLINLNEKRRVFDRPVGYLIPMISIFIMIGLWIVYAHTYNQKHDSTYFSTTIFPIWNLTGQEIDRVLVNTRKIWLDQYFHKSMLLFLVFCFAFVSIFYRKSNKLLFAAVLLILAEIIVYIILQFWTFADHDYYAIDMYILPVLIIISTFDILKRHFNKIFNAILPKVIFLLFLLFNIYYAHQKINQRYQSWMNDFQQTKDIYSITPYLRQLGITPDDTVISIPDESHASLYLMNQKGWTEYTDTKLNRGTCIRYNQDSAGIHASMNIGAKYLIINGIQELYKKPYLQSYCSNLTGHYRNVLIFNLKDKNHHFNLEKRIADATYHCDAELVNSDKQYFISESDSAVFQSGMTQSNECAHSGRYSAKIDVHSPYGMTIKLKYLMNGESFVISVWRKTNDKGKGGLVASSAPYPFYMNDYQILETDSNGWDRILMEFFIPCELTGQELVVYVYNPDKEPVYFDDLEIIRYRSIL